jgi:HK97 family phage portal protein
MRIPKLFQRQATAAAPTGAKGVQVLRVDDFLKGTYAPELAGRTRVWDNSAVMGCLLWIMDTIPEARPVVKIGDGDEADVVRDHRLMQLIADPNPHAGYSWYDLVGAWATSAKLDGNGYIRIRFDARYQPERLEYVPHTLVTPKEAYLGGGLDHYEIRTATGTERVAREEMLHLRIGIDPDNTLRGLSPVKAAMLEIMTDTEASIYNHTILKKLGVIGWIVMPGTPDGEFTEEQAKAAKSRIEGSFDSASGERGGVLAPSRQVKVEHVGHSPEEMQVREMRLTPEERICAVFRIPAIVVGLGAGLERATLANARELKELAVESCNAPLWARMGECLTRQLLPLLQSAPGEYVEFDTSKVRALQEDEDARHTRLRENWRAGGIRRSEFRTGIGMDAGAEDEVYIQEIAMRMLEERVMRDEASKSLERRRELYKSLAEGRVPS